MATPTANAHAHQEQQDFSNGILGGYATYIQDKYGKDRYQAVLNELGVEARWLENPSMWHSVDFNNKFHQAILKLIPEDPNIVFNNAVYMYTKHKGKFLRSFLGVFLSPGIFFKLLPSAAKRMNRYCTYEFEILKSEKWYASKGRLRQIARDPNHKFNEVLENVLSGSTTGVVLGLGYKLLDLRLVKKNEHVVEVEFSWTKNGAGITFLLSTLAAAVALGLTNSLANLTLVPKLIIASLSAMMTAVFWEYISAKSRMRDMFDYQNQVIDELRRANLSISNLNDKLLSFQNQISDVIELDRATFGIIHDMASPSTILATYSKRLTSFMEEGKLSSDQVLKYCKSIGSATEQLIVLQMLLRKIREGKISKQLKEIDITHLLNNILDLFDPLMEKKEVSVERVIENDLKIETYEGTVESVGFNLIQNALNSFSSKINVKKLRIEAKRTQEGVFISISDTGPGIPKERLQNIWQPFGHSSSSSEANEDARRFKGSGFGLSYVKDMVEKSGGTIEVKTGDNGTTFNISLPQALSNRNMTSNPDLRRAA